MISGRKYDGIMADIWSSGIVLYAMICGHLPFEDPDTKKLYKKIMLGKYEIPNYVSDAGKDLLSKILDINPRTRYNINDIKKHPWYSLITINEKDEDINNVTANSFVLSKIREYGIEPEVAKKYVEENKHNNITTTYYLLMQKMKKEIKNKFNSLSAIRKVFNGSFDASEDTNTEDPCPFNVTHRNIGADNELSHNKNKHRRKHAHNVTCVGKYNETIKDNRCTSCQKPNPKLLFGIEPNAPIQANRHIKQRAIIDRLTQKISSLSNRNDYGKRLTEMYRHKVDYNSDIPQRSNKRPFEINNNDSKEESYHINEMCPRVITNKSPKPLEWTLMNPYSLLNQNVNLNELMERRIGKLAHLQNAIVEARADSETKYPNKMLKNYIEAKARMSPVRNQKVPLVTTLADFSPRNIILDKYTGESIKLKTPINLKKGNNKRIYDKFKNCNMTFLN